MNFFEKFIKNIRKSDDETKKKWLWILASAFMTAVIILWIVYINHNVAYLGGEQEQEIVQVQTDSNSQPTFFEVLKTGAKIIVNKIKNFFQKTTSIEIQGNKTNFILENQEQIKPESLPK